MDKSFSDIKGSEHDVLPILLTLTEEARRLIYNIVNDVDRLKKSGRYPYRSPYIELFVDEDLAWWTFKEDHPVNKFTQTFLCSGGRYPIIEGRRNDLTNSFWVEYK